MIFWVSWQFARHRQDTIRIPRAVPISPESAALKAVLVRVRILVAIRARKMKVSSSRFVPVIMVFT